MLRKFIFSFKKIILNNGIIRTKDIKSKTVTKTPEINIIKKKKNSFFVKINFKFSIICTINNILFLYEFEPLDKYQAIVFSRPW